LVKPTTRRDELRVVAESFQTACITLATGGKLDYETWEAARADLLSQPELLRSLPDWISRCRFGGQFWPFVRDKSPTYAGRRTFLYDSLKQVFDAVEHGSTQPTAISLEAILKSCTSSTVGEAWARIQARREADPEGAITAARALLESTCKYVLDQLKIEYAENEDLPKLYGQAASAMNLGPENHSELVFKQIMSGCISVVNGLAALRNTLGDAHGRAARAPKPGSRHADLAINLAGTLSTFLVATYEERFAKA
jgi:hypothetical protein